MVTSCRTPWSSGSQCSLRVTVHRLWALVVNVPTHIIAHAKATRDLVQSCRDRSGATTEHKRSRVMRTKVQEDNWRKNSEIKVWNLHPASVSVRMSKRSCVMPSMLRRNNPVCSTPRSVTASAHRRRPNEVWRNDLEPSTTIRESRLPRIEETSELEY